MAESGEFREKQCFDIFTGILGRKLAVKHWKEIYLCILAVDCGLKTSYLADQCCLKPAQMDKLVTNLRCEKFISRGDLHTVVIYGDIFVLQSEKMLNYLNCMLNERCVCFVDISQSLSEAKILNSDGNFWTSIKRFCLEFNDFIQHCKTDTHFMPRTFEFEDKILHPCSIFGIILAYPVIYWLTKESEMNCLSQINLSVYSSEIALESWQGKNQDFVTVCSFSFPGNLTAYCEKYIESWKNNVTAISQKQTLLVHRIMCKQVRLPVVIL